MFSSIVKIVYGTFFGCGDDVLEMMPIDDPANTDNNAICRIESIGMDTTGIFSNLRSLPPDVIHAEFRIVMQFFITSQRDSLTGKVTLIKSDTFFNKYNQSGQLITLTDWL